MSITVYSQTINGEGVTSYGRWKNVFWRGTDEKNGTFY